MRRRALAATVSALLVLAVLACGRAQAAAVADAAIVVTGNRHVDAQTIRSHFHAGTDGRLDAAALDAAFKSLYATGLFKDVKISRAGGRVLVTVVENPTIKRLAFEGNKKIKDEDLGKVVRSKAAGPLAPAIVHDDVENIIALYRQHAYFDVRVVPKTIRAGSGGAGSDRVDLVFEIKEGDKLAVRQVLFAGNRAYPQSKLKGVIKTGESNLLSFLIDNDGYDAERIDGDVDLLRRFYRARGFADVRVAAAASYDKDKKGVVVTFTIEEGTRYHLGTVDVASHLRAVDATALRRYLRTQAGEVYDADAIDKTVEDMTIGLAQSGEPFATVTARSDRVPPPAPPGPAGATRAGAINLRYVVDAGKRLYVERIEIHGNTRTRDELIRRQFDLVEGDAFNRALIDRAERRLQQLGYFKSVKIGTQPGSAPDRVVVDVAVEEQSTGTFAFSGGYSGTGGWSIEVGIGERNFLGSGDIAKASVTYGQYIMGFDLSLTDPYFLGQPLSLGVDLFGKETLASSYQSYDSTVYGAKLAFGTPLNDQAGVQWTYAIYNQGLTLDPALGTASLPIQQAAAMGSMWVSSVGTTASYSTLDNPRNPTGGVRLTTDNEFAGLGGAAKFARSTEDARYYHEIVGDVVGMVRAQGGYETPWGGQSLPLLDGFFGGPQLIRGFAPNGFGPRDVTPGTIADNLGGNAYWTTTAELQAPLPLVPADAQLRVALFADAGSLWATGASTVASLASALSPAQQIANSHAVRASLGAGLVWNSMFGPIEVDYAYPIAKQSYDVTQRLNFTAGGF